MQIIDFAVVESPPHKKTETYATALLILTEEELIAIDLLEPRLAIFRDQFISLYFIYLTVYNLVKVKPTYAELNFE